MSGEAPPASLWVVTAGFLVGVWDGSAVPSCVGVRAPHSHAEQRSVA